MFGPKTKNISVNNIKRINSSSNKDVRNFFTLNLSVLNNEIQFTIVDTSISFQNLGLPNSLDNLRGNAKGLTPSLKTNLLKNCIILKNSLNNNFITKNNIIQFINSQNNISILLFNLDTNNKIITNNIKEFYVHISEGIFGSKPQIYKLNIFLEIINHVNNLTIQHFSKLNTIDCDKKFTITPTTSNNNLKKLYNLIQYYLTKGRCGLLRTIRNVHFNDKIIIFEKDNEKVLFDIEIIKIISEYTPFISFRVLKSLSEINTYQINGIINRDLLLKELSKILFNQLTMLDELKSYISTNIIKPAYVGQFEEYQSNIISSNIISNKSIDYNIVFRLYNTMMLDAETGFEDGLIDVIIYDKTQINYNQELLSIEGGSKKLKDCTVLQLRKLMKKHKKSCYKDGKALKKSSMIRILQKC